ncbi:MAG: MFS transporter [Ignisphaera sp.]|nr:MFS transporter [Ignisphaera sp.]MCX8167629.1 MFS transporter [Ignisphaera sp.]MDW8085960.1 MFS transporter [Ignisphaera sp.]
MSRGEVSNLRALLYGYGSLMGVGSSLVVGWLLYYYCPPGNSGVEPLAPIVIMGAAMLFGRVVDAISDPLVGYWSDKTLTRWGRRRPFIVAGFTAMAASQVAVWRPPIHGYSIWNAVYASVLLGVFWFGYTAAVAPYLALLPEIALAPGERVKLVAYQTLFSQLSLIIGGVAVPILLGTLGYISTSLVLTAIAASSMISIVLPFRERSIGRDRIAKGLNLWRALKITYTNKVFLAYLIPTALLVLSTTMAQIALPYLVTVSAGLDKSYVAIVYLPMIAISVLTLPLYRKLTSRYGKKRIYMAGMVLFIIPTTAVSIVGIAGVEPALFLMAVGVLFGFFVTPLLMLPNAFIADITDIDEKITGYRREAIYFGAQGFITKSMAGLAGVLISLLLEHLGYTPGADLGIRMSFVLSGLLLIPAVAIFSRYPLKE